MRPTAIIVLSVVLVPSAAAQEWLTSFKPHRRCVTEITHTTAPDLPAGTTRLLLRAFRTHDDAPISAPIFRITSLDTTADPPTEVGLFATLDSSRLAQRDGLPPGRYVVQALYLGYNPRTDTVMLSVDRVTTASMFLQVPYSGVPCHPPGYRRDGERACVTDRSLVEEEWEHANHYAWPRIRKGVPRYRRDEISVITDEPICVRAAQAYGLPGDPLRKVIVLRLGTVGYIVHDPFEPIRGGEFTYTEFFDRRFRRLVAWTR